MFTKQWYKAFATQMTGGAISDGYKAFNGTAYATSYYQNAYLYQFSPYNTMKTVLTSYNVSSPSPGVMFGTGDTPPTVDDYTLSGSLISTISAGVSRSAGSDSEGTYCTGTYTITNTGNEEITIKEVCLFMSLPYGNGYSRGCCCERTVLETPVTIPAGGIGQVVYTVRVNFAIA